MIKRRFSLLVLSTALFLCVSPVDLLVGQTPSVKERTSLPPIAKNPGWLGVGLRSIDIEEQKALGVDYPVVIVRQVFKNTPAHRSGFKEGDRILLVDNHAIRLGVKEMVAHIKSHSEGDTIPIQVMRDGITRVITTTLGVVPNRRQLIESAWLQKKVPLMTVHDVNTGAEIKTADFIGKVVILDYWATWCNPCKRATPILEELYQEYANQELVILGVSDEKREVLQTYAMNRPVEYLMAYDADRTIATTLYISSYPTFIVIDKTGTIRSISTGLAGAERLQAVVEPLLKEEMGPEDKKEIEPTPNQ